MLFGWMNIPQLGHGKDVLLSDMSRQDSPCCLAEEKSRIKIADELRTLFHDALLVANTKDDRGS